MFVLSAPPEFCETTASTKSPTLRKTVVSALTERPVPADTVVFGEIALSGDVRPVGHTEARLKEAAKLGFGTAWMPLRRSPGAGRSRTAETGLKTAAIGHLSELVTRLSSRHAPHRRSAMEITR